MFENLRNKVWRKGAVAAVCLSVVVILLLPIITFAQAPQTGTAGNLVGSFAERWLYSFVQSVFGTLAGIGGSLLNISINNYVVGFGDIYTTKGLGNTIDALWVIVRDIFNLTFIFGLVFIGLKMIFDSSDSSTKKLLVSLILAALFVNFSLFITKFVVDFSNIATVQVVNAFPLNSNGERDVSGAFANVMGFTSVMKIDEFQTKFSGGGGLGFIFGTMFVYIISMFVFIGGALLIMIRFVVLNLYMMLSPLMFLGWVFPSASSISKEYWKGFLGRAFFAPAYILMLYFSYRIMTAYTAINPRGGATLGNAFSNGAGLEEVLPPFILTAIFLIASIVIAQKMGAQGASGVISVGKNMAGSARKYTQQKAGAATFGLAAAAGRNTIGYGASKITNNDSMKRFAAKSRIGQKSVGALAKVADSSFDARNVGGLGAKIGIGAGAKGGFDSRQKEIKKQDEEYAKSMGKVALKNADGTYKVIGKDENGNDITAVTNYNKIVSQRRSEPNSALAKNNTEYAQANATVTSATSKLDEAKRQLALAGQTTQPAIRKKLEDNVTQAQKAATEAEQIRKKIQEQENNILEGIKKEADSSIIYSNQLAFIERRQKEANRYSGLAAMTGSLAAAAGLNSGIGLGVSAAISGGVGLGAGVITGVASQASGAKAQNSVDNLKKIYGETGINAVKNEQEGESMSKLVKKLKEAQDAEDAGKATPKETT